MNVFCKLAASTVLVLICIACSAQEKNNKANHPSKAIDKTIDSAIKNDKRANNMTSLTLKIANPEVTVLQGTPIHISLIIENTGDSSVNVHSAESPSTFEYVLRNKNGGEALVLSEKTALLNRLGDPIPPLPMEYVALEPSQSLSYQDEILRFSQTDIAAGEYALSVYYDGPGGRIESASIALTVTAVSVQSISMFANTLPVNYLTSIYTQQDKKSQQISIYQRDSKPDDPQDGISYFRTQLASDTFKGVALAIEMGNVHDTNWFATLVDQSLNVQLAGREKIYLTMDPIKLALTDPQLFPVGWQMNVSDGWATTVADVYFSLLGFDANKQLVFSLIKINADSGQIENYSVSLGVAGQPGLWKVKAIFAETGPQEFQLLLETVEGNGARKLDLFMLDPAAGQLKSKMTLPIEADGIDALSFYPVATGYKESIDILLNNNQRKEMIFKRFSVENEKVIPAYSHTFNNSKDANNELIKNWVLPSRPLTPPIAAAALNDTIVSREISDNSAEQIISRNQANSSLLNIELIGEQIWLIWFNSETGFMYQKI